MCHIGLALFFSCFSQQSVALVLDGSHGIIITSDTVKAFQKPQHKNPEVISISMF